MTSLTILAANWWEPGQNGTFDIGDLSAIFMFALAVIGAMVGFNRWWFKKLRKMIREEIREFTKPIQPTANGGKSLPDVARRVEVLETMIIDLKTSTDETREMLVNYIIKDADRHGD